MEYKLEASEISCLIPVVSQTRQQEQTQEVKLSDGMPDIGRILGCWGQPMIRGKDWRSDSIGVNGGVMAWVLYAPEDGTAPRSLSCWIPFQTRYDISNTQADGVITASVQLVFMDARISSARRIMVRCALQLDTNALVPSKQTVFTGENIPKHVQLLQETYPLQVSVEAGEREVTAEESILLPANAPNPETILRYYLQPRITETKLMGSRLVFRGLCSFRMVYMTQDGDFRSWDTEMPIAQFADLRGEYGDSALCRCVPVVTGTELDRGEDGKFRLKAAVTVQYEIIDRILLRTVEDAYCPGFTVDLQTEALKIPTLLDMQTDTVGTEQTIRADAREILDSCTYISAHNMPPTDSGICFQLQADTQVLYRDENNQLQYGSVRTGTQWQLPSQADNAALLQLLPGMSGATGGDDIHIHCDTSLHCAVYGITTVEMIRSLSLSEKPDAQQQPAVILKRVNGKRLWDIAKESGSTVDAICKANKLEQEPLDDRMLLIPVLS
jgi:hypothetical protein